MLSHLIWFLYPQSSFTKTLKHATRSACWWPVREPIWNFQPKSHCISWKLLNSFKYLAGALSPGARLWPGFSNGQFCGSLNFLTVFIGGTITKKSLDLLIWLCSCVLPQSLKSFKISILHYQTAAKLKLGKVLWARAHVSVDHNTETLFIQTKALLQALLQLEKDINLY